VDDDDHGDGVDDADVSDGESMDEDIRDGDSLYRLML